MRSCYVEWYVCYSVQRKEPGAFLIWHPPDTHGGGLPKVRNSNRGLLESSSKCVVDTTGLIRVVTVQTQNSDTHLSVVVYAVTEKSTQTLLQDVQAMNQECLARVENQGRT